MFWRVDEKLKALMRDPQWVAFHRACGREGLFFDDIDPLNDDPKKDVTDKMRGRGYQAVAFRADTDKGGHYVQVFRGRGTGQGPIDAVISAYEDAIKRGDTVSPGHEQILLNDASATAPGHTDLMLPPDEIDAFLAENPPPVAELDIESLIG